MALLWEFIINLAAGLVGDLLSPRGMTGLVIAALVIVAWLIAGHRRQRAAKKSGMASWQFVTACFVIAMLATAFGGYGLGVLLADRKVSASSNPMAFTQTATVTTDKDTIITDLRAKLDRQQEEIEKLRGQQQPPQPSQNPGPFFSGGPTTDPVSQREYTNRTVQELLGLYKDKTAFQADKLMEPYKGMWIETEGIIVGVYPDGPGAVVPLKNGDKMIECRFNAQWSRQLGRYNNGESLKVRGKISTTQNGQQLYLLY